MGQPPHKRPAEFLTHCLSASSATAASALHLVPASQSSRTSEVREFCPPIELPDGTARVISRFEADLTRSLKATAKVGADCGVNFAFLGSLAEETP